MREIYLVDATFVEGTPEGPEAAARAALAAAHAQVGAVAVDTLRVGGSGPLPPDLAARLAFAAGLRPSAAATEAPPGGAAALMSLCEAISGGWAELGLAVGIQAGPPDTGPGLGLPDPCAPAADALTEALAWRIGPAGLAAATALLEARHPHAPEAAAWARALGLPPEAATPGAAPAGPGASACLLASAEAVAEHTLRPRARIVSLGRAAADPALWPLGAAEAATLALHRLGFAAADLRLAALDAPTFGALAGVAAALGLPPHKAAAGAGALGPGPGGPRAHLGAADPIARLPALLDGLVAVDGRFGLLASAWSSGQGAAFVIDLEFYV